ncbi:hypothetical protein R3P38DRAFT_1054042 [Favolaschia claudopus]|uniref:Uncharacterized protein n=1 Tax=Favolaschia claudopus TaxID=2862362 RepID=A0AAW0BEU7_9AGAR
MATSTPSLPTDPTLSVPRVSVSEGQAMSESSDYRTSVTLVSSSSPDNTDISPSLTSVILPSSSASDSQRSSGTKQNNLARIIAGVLVPVLFLVLCGVAYILYKRRRRARDRGEWERTHAEIADVVREAGTGELPAGLPAWSLSRVDTKVSPDIRGGNPTVVEKNGPAEALSSPSSMI